jgi:hypothetical protein
MLTRQVSEPVQEAATLQEVIEALEERQAEKL